MDGPSELTLRDRRTPSSSFPSWVGVRRSLRELTLWFGIESPWRCFLGKALLSSRMSSPRLLGETEEKMGEENRERERERNEHKLSF